MEIDKSYAREIQRMVKTDGLTNSVTFLGQILDDELSIHIKKAQVLAVPSSYEGFGIVYLEAMGFGLPVIASNAGATAEIITHGKDGFLIPAGEEITLASHLIELNYNRDKLSMMGLNAYRRYQRHPTWKQTCENITGFLESVLKSS